MRTTFLATIATGDTTSNVVDLKEGRLTAIITKSLVSTSFTISAGTRTDNLRKMYKADGNALTLTVAGNRYILLSPDDWQGARHVQFIAGSTETNGAEIELVVVK